MNAQNHCTNLKGLLSTERAAIQCHLDGQMVAGGVSDRREAVRSFIEGYGGLMRELYCAHSCQERGRCGVSRAHRLSRGFLQAAAS